MKTCTKCDVDKPLDDFYKSVRSPDGHVTMCKMCACSCQRRRYRGYRAEKRPRLTKSQSHRQWRYGLTPQAYDALLVKQKGKCPICKKPFGQGAKEKPHVDHCHRRKVVRGLLHTTCNTALGLLAEDEARFRRAIKYLKTQ